MAAMLFGGTPFDLPAAMDMACTRCPSATWWVARAKLLLLDEPAAGLNYDEKEQSHRYVRY